MSMTVTGPVFHGLHDDLIESDIDYGTQWRCATCGWESNANTDSARFRADRHMAESGHHVLLVPVGAVPGFDDAMGVMSYDVETW